jgi:CubicO group peptidase (beta-lactamase class C family)
MTSDPFERVPRTRQALETGISDGLHLGAQLYASLDGRVAADGALGEDRPGVPLTRDHLVLWLSATKPAAAVALARLWERGRLELDDPVARHVPEFAANGKERITLRHLLTHTAGIRMPDVGWPRDPWDEIVARICAMKPEPRWVPGEKAGYNHASSWFVLGEVVRRLDGRPFDRYVREEVFEPLGMTDSWVGMPRDRYLAYREAGRIGAMWKTEPSPPEPHGWDSEPRCVTVHPGGNGYGPVRELGRFYEMILGRGSPVLSPQSVEALTARHRVGMMDRTFQHVLDWGLGFIPNSARYGAETVPYAYGHHASRRAVGHSGYRSSVAFADPERRLAVALVFNGTPSNEAHERRIRSVLDALYEDLDLTAA